MGYCPHNQLLFSTWHRPYLMLFEVASRTVSLCLRMLTPGSKNYRKLRRVLRISSPVQQGPNTRTLPTSYGFLIGIGQRLWRLTNQFIQLRSPTKGFRSRFPMALQLLSITLFTNTIFIHLITENSMEQ